MVLAATLVKRRVVSNVAPLSKFLEVAGGEVRLTHTRPCTTDARDLASRPHRSRVCPSTPH